MSREITNELYNYASDVLRYLYNTNKEVFNISVIIAVQRILVFILPAIIHFIIWLIFQKKHKYSGGGEKNFITFANLLKKIAKQSKNKWRKSLIQKGFIAAQQSLS